MKIIGKTENGFIADLTSSELALILGFRSVMDSDYRRKKISTGDDVEIVKMADTAKFIRGLDVGKLSSIIRDLESAISGVDDATSTVRALTLFETLKEDHSE